MSEVIIYGLPLSTFVQTARITCNEKGITHKNDPIEFGSEIQKKLHPWGKIPVMDHGGVRLFETSAICHYIDKAFEGPALQPSDAATLGLMEQWVSIVGSYLYPGSISGYALHYILPRGEDGKPDRKAIEAGLPRVKHDYELLDKAYQGRKWIAGDMLTLADFFVMPVVATVNMFPEGKEILSGCGNVMRAYDAMQSRPTYQAALPAMPAS